MKRESRSHKKETNQKLKNRKVAGKNYINNELIKMENLSAKPPSVYKTTRMENVYCNTNFHKRGYNSFENYKEINLLNIVLKNKIKIFQSKPIECIDLEQQDFNRGWSCINALIIIQWIKEKAVKFWKPIFMCFVDL